MHLTLIIYHCVFHSAAFESLSRADVCIAGGESVQPTRKGDPFAQGVRTGLVSSFDLRRTCSLQCYSSCVSVFSHSILALTAMILGVKVIGVV